MIQTIAAHTCLTCGSENIVRNGHVKTYRQVVTCLSPGHRYFFPAEAGKGILASSGMFVLPLNMRCFRPVVLTNVLDMSKI
jgi:hypothetical protein